MTVLLDTHTLLWFLWDDPKLSRSARATIAHPEHFKLVSVASCWEIAIKTSLCKLDLGEPAGTFLTRELVRNNFELLPISLEHATFVETLPFHHRDPFDRLLIAQSLCERIPLISVDGNLDRYGIERIW